MTWAMGEIAIPGECSDTEEPSETSVLTKNGKERAAFVRLDPSGFFIRHPPPPHELDTFITPDGNLFQTIHMGAAVVDSTSYKIVIDGLVERPLAVTLEELKRMPQVSFTAFHECYGSPLKSPTKPCMRIGNVRWTGVRLSHLLDLASFHHTEEARFIWSEGLDRGSFAGVEADRYQKDLPMAKALRPETMVAYEMNGEPLSKERGGPARLVVPGYFGTNSTKWLCRLSVRSERAPGLFTTTFYNEVDPQDPEGQRMRPVWHAEVNSIIVRPRPNEVLVSQQVSVYGWAWSDDGVEKVEVSGDDGETWLEAIVESRMEFGWQKFERTLHMQPGRRSIVGRATSWNGEQQPLTGRRNHVHRVQVIVEDG
jgi:DMSO/TMAO reductase YedYZ molybdopterin-dependent catalytic subunit